MPPLFFVRIINGERLSRNRLQGSEGGNEWWEPLFYQANGEGLVSIFFVPLLPALVHITGEGLLSIFFVHLLPALVHITIRMKARRAGFGHLPLVACSEACAGPKLGASMGPGAR